MTLTPGTKLGPYEILSPLGAGGMGEVYRAKDTRLDRTVAVKILPSHLSENSEAKQRFDREARTISSLNHPNICTLHDVGHQDGIDYLVMEYLEGETLAERLRKGPLPVEQVLKYGFEICQGLEKAHRSGVVHRDLKPGNIMLTKTGTKLMDFGLAKATPLPPTASSLTATLDPDREPPLTARGTVLGTFQYMSPEQLEGKDVDARSDIFALGAVLYEMASGKRAFDGKTVASVIASVLAVAPPAISATQPASPASLDRVVQNCLEKDPDERFQNVHDVKLELKWITEGDGGGAKAPAPPGSRRIAWAGAALAALAAITLGAFQLTRTPEVKYPIRTSIAAPENSTFLFLGDQAGPLVLSPDGRKLAFVANPLNDAAKLYIRLLDAAEPTALSGIENATSPFWSPDSQRVAFFADGKLKTVGATGGVITVCDAETERGGSWGKDGTIVFSPGYRNPIYRVPASGGTPVQVTQIDETKHTSHRWPFFLPDGQHFLYLAINHESPQHEEAALYFASVDGRENVAVMPAITNAQFAEGYLLYSKEGVLQAQPFDAKRGKMLGDPQAVTTGISEDGSNWRALFTVSRNGQVAYSGGAQTQTQLAWFDRTGKQLGLVGEKFPGLAGLYGPQRAIRLSPRADRVALAIPGSVIDVWVMDLSRGARTRLTFGPVGNNNPVWSPDEQWVAYNAVIKQGSSVRRKPAAGGAEEELIQDDHELVRVADWSWDGKYLLLSKGSIGRAQEIWAMPLSGNRRAFRLEAAGKYITSFPRFSPDGHWVSYQSNESGRPEIYVVPFPTGQGKWQISTGGGTWARWRGDGKEIFYTTVDRTLTAVPVEENGHDIHLGAPQSLFRLPGDIYDVGPDGHKFLVDVVGDQSTKPITLLQNWTSVLKH
jgi:Tol biopolymer transport system component